MGQRVTSVYVGPRLFLTCGKIVYKQRVRVRVGLVSFRYQAFLNFAGLYYLDSRCC